MNNLNLIIGDLIFNDKKSIGLVVSRFSKTEIIVKWFSFDHKNYSLNGVQPCAKHAWYASGWKIQVKK